MSYWCWVRAKKQPAVLSVQLKIFIFLDVEVILGDPDHLRVELDGVDLEIGKFFIEFFRNRPAAEADQQHAFGIGAKSHADRGVARIDQPQRRRVFQGHGALQRAIEVHVARFVVLLDPDAMIECVFLQQGFRPGERCPDAKLKQPNEPRNSQPAVTARVTDRALQSDQGYYNQRQTHQSDAQGMNDIAHAEDRNQIKRGQQRAGDTAAGRHRVKRAGGAADGM